MASSVSSVSSLGDDVGHHEATPRLSHAQIPERGASEYNESHDQHETPHDASTTRQRLLAEESPMTPGHTVTEMIEKHPQKRHLTPWYHDWWFWEVLGAIMSLGATAAIVVILAFYNNKPLPNWRNGITLNAMVSVLSTISKTTMLFAVTECIGQAKWLEFQKHPHHLIDFHNIDEGSRGPWAATLLILRMKGRAVLASVGALVLTLSLAVDPFTQQVLSYPIRSDFTSEYAPPIFPTVTSWGISGEASIGDDAKKGGDLSSALSLSMRAAIYETIFSLGRSSSTLRVNCPTGNCTFSPADTLGFCSTCNDVTADLTKSCHTGDVGIFKNGATNCTYHLPGNLDVPINETVYPYDFGSSMAQSPNFTKTGNMSIATLPRYQTLYAAGNAADPGSGIVVQPSSKPAVTNFQGISDPLLAFGRVVFNNSFIPVPIIGGDVEPQATECALYWCVQTLNMSVQNGIISQKTLQIWKNGSAADIAQSYLSPPSDGTQAPRNYYVSEMANLPLVDFLQKTFTANMSGMNLPGMGKTPEELAELIEWSSDAAQALWNVEDLDGFMSSLADRMTDTLRNQSPDLANSPQGNVLVMQTYVHVSWPWLILLVALVILSCLLLLASIIASHGPGNVVWKNSSLAVLFHGLAANKHGGYLVNQKEMEEAAEDISVQLQRDGNDDLHLVSVQRMSGGVEKARSSGVSRLLGAKRRETGHIMA